MPESRVATPWQIAKNRESGQRRGCVNNLGQTSQRLSQTPEMDGVGTGQGRSVKDSAMVDPKFTTIQRQPQFPIFRSRSEAEDAKLRSG